MKICRKCERKFPFSVIIEGKKRNLGARRYCLDCSPFGSKNRSDLIKERPAKIDSLSNDEFSELVKNSRSRAQIFDNLNMRASGSSYFILNRRLEKDNLDLTHFKLGIDVARQKRHTNDEIFVVNSLVSFNCIRMRIIKCNLIPYKCKHCEITNIWNNKSITLELDHINGMRKDNRLENLRWLCPNCHSQTSTYAGKRLKKHKVKISSVYPDWRNRPKMTARKAERPPKEELENLLKTQTVTSIAEKYGLKSGNSIKKWAEGYSLDYKQLSPFSRMNHKKKERITVFTPKSKYLYVSYKKSVNKWVASIQNNEGKYIFFRIHNTELEAAQAIADYKNSNILLLR